MEQLTMTQLAATFASIEAQLTKAAELHFGGTIDQELHESMLRGAMLLVPMLAAPRHIPVLKKLRDWKDTELIPEVMYQRMYDVIVAAARPPTEVCDSATSAAASVTSTAVEAPVAKRKAEAPASAAKPADQQSVKRPANQHSIASMVAALGGQRLKTAAAELKLQREAASRGEDYRPLEEKMAEFKSEEESVPPVDRVVNQFGCSKCAMVFSCRIALTNHERAHGASAKERGSLFESKP